MNLTSGQIASACVFAALIFTLLGLHAFRKGWLQNKKEVEDAEASLDVNLDTTPGPATVLNVEVLPVLFMKCVHCEQNLMHGRRHYCITGRHFDVPDFPRESTEDFTLVPYEMQEDEVELYPYVVPDLRRRPTLGA